MNQQDLGRKLIESVPGERRLLLREHPALIDAGLARTLQQICYELWTDQPQKVTVIVEILRDLHDLTGSEEVKAYAEWTAAIESLIKGRLEDCLRWLDKSEKRFSKLGSNHAAAATQISRLYALALLGRYDEAVACGLRARDVFLAENDLYSAGKIEHNIGNLYWRRDFYRESGPYLASARRRFEQIGDQRQLAMVENCQAFVAALQNRFRRAEAIYRRALRRAVENNLTVTEAEIETGLSNLYLFQGRYDLALGFMERARQKYELIGMPHQSSGCELEMADIYLELNLLPEAVARYRKTDEQFGKLGLQAELARSRLNHAKALFLLGENSRAATLLDGAGKLFEAEGNPVLVALTRLFRAQFFYWDDELEKAEHEAGSALRAFVEGGNRRYECLARWLSGEIRCRRGEAAEAEEIFRRTLDLARADRLRPVEYLCLIGLGRVTGEEKFFLEAVDLVENSRAALSAEELRTAFFANKLLPYDELVKIRLAESDFSGALSWHERSRSRTLLEMMNGDGPDLRQDPELASLREELNWLYSRINRQTASGLEVREGAAELQKQAARRERVLAGREHRLRNGGKAGAALPGLDPVELRGALAGSTVVEFAFIDHQLWTFLIADGGLQAFRFPGEVESLRRETEQFLFQIKTGRALERFSPASRGMALERTLRHAQNLYEILLRPLEAFLPGGRLTVIPAGFLHYLPFQALHDGDQFLVETREINYAPSLAVLRNCLARKASRPQNALLVGVADGRTPFVNAEIEEIGKLFPSAVELRDEAATLENLRRSLYGSDVLHLACHGKFRLDNPDFSALNLFTGNLTVKDARQLDLRDKLVVLSACETGLNKWVSGEELFGLMRGFLLAGASSLLLSLWTVNDRSTAGLMHGFYRSLLAGERPGRALQTSQTRMLKENAHPYFWAPFNLVGRW